MTFDGTHIPADYSVIASVIGHPMLLPQSIVDASLAERAAFRAYIGCEPDAIRDHEHTWMMKAVELAALVSHHVNSGCRSC